MAEVEKLVAVGKQLGLVDKDLQAWITEQQNIERDKRAEERASEKEKR